MVVSLIHFIVTPSVTNELVVGWMAAFVGALGVLFAVGAIVAAFLLFKQGRDHRQLIQEAIDRFDSRLSTMVAEKDAQVSTAIAQVQAEITAAKGHLAEVGDDVRASVESNIASLSQLKAQLEKTLEEPNRYRAIGRGRTKDPTLEERLIGRPSHAQQSRGARALTAALSGQMETLTSPATPTGGLIMCKKCWEEFSPHMNQAMAGDIARCPYCGELNRWKTKGQPTP